MYEESMIDEIISDIDFEANNFNDINGLMLTNREISVLESYGINYRNCNSLKEILFMMEVILNDMEIVDEDLEYVSMTISERDYYQNTDK